MSEINQVKFWRVPYPLAGNIFLFGRVGCLDEDTEIYVVENNEVVVRKLKELPENFNVVSYNFARQKQKYKQEITPAIKIDSGEKECYEITFYDGEKKAKIIASEDHIFFSPKGKEVKVKDLKVYDRIFARNCNLGNRNPTKREDVRKIISAATKGEKNGMYGKRFKQSYETKEHLRQVNLGARNPMFGKKMSKEAKDKIAFAMSGDKNPMFGKIAYPKLTYDNDLKHKIRSSWERNVCLKLMKLGIKYEFEKQRFKVLVKGKCLTYTPDIKLSDNHYIEVKGHIFDWQIVKMIAFKKQYPHIKLTMITAKKNIAFKLFKPAIDYYSFIEQEGLCGLKV